MDRRTKFSPPPTPLPTENDKVLLSGLVRSAFYPVLLDEIQRYAINLEIEAFLEQGNERTLLAHVHAARSAWMVLDGIQRRIEGALAPTEDQSGKTPDSSDGYDGVSNVDRVLGSL